jgi:quercetin dioxygenase-like cupin family protein
MRLFLLAAATAASLAAVPVLAAEPAPTSRVVFSHDLPNAPGKMMRAVEIDYPPGTSSNPHRHSQSIFIYAYVVSGSLVNQIEGEPERLLKPGDVFFENPGAHHVQARNASKTEPAKLLVVSVDDKNDANATIPDK